MANADTTREIRTFLTYGNVHRGRIAPRGPLGERSEVAERRADELVEAGLLVHVVTYASGTRWFKLTTAGRNVALTGVAA